MKIKERAVKLKLQIPAVFLALKDRRTPWYAKVLAGITVAYAFSPDKVWNVPKICGVAGNRKNGILRFLLYSFGG